MKTAERGWLWCGTLTRGPQACLPALVLTICGAGAAACAATPTPKKTHPTPDTDGNNAGSSPGSSAYLENDARTGPVTEPTLSVLATAIEQDECVEIPRMPSLFAQLESDEFRVRLGEVVSEGRMDPNQALTYWLLLAAEYQERCKLVGDAESNPANYIDASAPLPESAVETALENNQCRFLKSVAKYETWPYELRMSREVLSRDFRGAEITRRLWISVLQDFGESCNESLSRREAITIEANLERLERIIGLDDPTLIDLRSKMLESLDAGEEDKVLAFARAIAEREKTLNAVQAADYDAKLAALESRIAQQDADLERVETSKLVEKSGEVASTTANVAETAENVAKTAKAAKTTINIVRSLF